MTIWRRSQRCDSSACVEVGCDGDEVLMRNSNLPNGPVLRFTSDEWTAFTAGVMAGEFKVDAMGD